MTLLYPSILWLLIPLAILWYHRPKKLNDTVHIIILILITLALTRPVINQKPVESQIEANDIIIALDASYSMQAKDLSPSRYVYAKEVINELLKSNQTDNIMLIAFTTNPLLLSPPTTDHALISIALESLDPDNILTHGTSLKKLFEKISALPMSDKHVVLFTDGGEEKDIALLNSTVRDNALSLTVLALGTTAGTTIKKKDGSLLKDNKGDLVVSRINPLLERLALSNGGRYILSPSSPDAAAEAIEESLEEQMVPGNKISKIEKSMLELYQIPLFLALLLFLILHTRAVKILLPIAALWGVHLNASIFDGHYLHQAYEYYQQGDYNATEKTLAKIETVSLQSRMADANTYYKQERYKKALAAYRSIRSTSPETKQRLYYNIGNCHAKMKAYDKAKRYYIKALQLGDDADAQYNLKFVVLKKSEAESKLPFARPKSQGGSSGTTEDQDEDEGKKSDDEQQENSGSGGGGGQTKAKSKEKMMVIQPGKREKQPLSSRAYDLINKGYVHEKEPW
ncbi:MAG: VWA domain-containing protein [Campylobacterota bacterium]|nr:VWA domain-containing protein [Campylobacterota bacterium]